VPYVVHMFNIIKFPRLGKLLCFFCYGQSVVRPTFSILMPVILMMLSVKVVLIVSI
jgi:hypothetical protein